MVSATSRRAACSTACAFSLRPMCSAVSWVSSPAPSGSTNTPQTSRSASYPDVPSTGHDTGSSSPTPRIFSTSSHRSGPIAARSRRA